ncbi:uncharacterized protein CLAFUR5_09295 [Fulvia fulva]|uniref:Uncharacterized protein n=1 Tax=Passalora fulva TaxID=5499 RepID=A0A9Q8UT67_PASFU|nr:uncharacterized protein CLAFUR5_09295 [Fulvia fulva]UJO21551.1 hypothetical protein CLAFUR5_09295 [Fulvia fulva]
MQNVIPEELVAMLEFKNILSSLESLGLEITTEFHNAAPECNIDFPEVYQFFAIDLKKQILHPVSSNLRHLNLCTAEMEWGFRPPFDPRGLHFPKLVSLALGKVMFAYDWQLDWIIGHDKTLEVLALTDCMILAVGDPEEGIENPSSPDERNRWVYNRRWHEYFSRLQHGLPLLKRFIMHDSSSEFKFEGLQGLEALYRSSAELSTGRYGLWADLSVYKPVHTKRGPIWDHNADEENGPTSRICYVEEKEALDGLLEAIQVRRGC